MARKLGAGDFVYFVAIATDTPEAGGAQHRQPGATGVILREMTGEEKEHWFAYTLDDPAGPGYWIHGLSGFGPWISGAWILSAVSAGAAAADDLGPLEQPPVPPAPVLTPFWQ
jgi:hypothetical protein